MTAIPRQSLEFLQCAAPFDVLDHDDLLDVASKINVVYMTQEDKEAILREQGAVLFIVSSGQFSVSEANNPQRHVSEGDFFGHELLLEHRDEQVALDIDKPGLLYCLPASAFKACLDRYPQFASFFRTYKNASLQNDAVQDTQSMWLNRRLKDVLQKSPICADVGISIGEGAGRMAQHGVSSLLLTSNHKLVGVITDRDLRNRVVAVNRPLDEPLFAIMTADPICADSTQTLFDALCQMTEHHVHHLPVIDRSTGKPIGMVTASDMVRYQRGNVLFLFDELAKTESLYELNRAAWQIPHYFAQHAKKLGDFDVASKVLSQATDIMTRKLITFFQRQHGAAPMSYCWLVYGSQAREDQVMGSDQDNALLLEKRPDEAQEAYFKAMADYVCQGLAKCGIKLCDGNIMASNDALRLGLEDAIEETRRWVAQPTPDAIMHINIFLDARAVAGNADLFKALQDARGPILKTPMFLAALARHTNSINVPLSMFQRFVFEKHGNRDDCIDLKVNAQAIVNNLARLYALANEMRMPATLARLNAMDEDCGLAEKDRRNLADIWLLLNRLRWRHHLSQDTTDNKVSMSTLSSLEKHQLKAAFQAIDRAQQAAVMKFAGGMG